MIVRLYDLLRNSCLCNTAALVTSFNESTLGYPKLFLKLFCAFFDRRDVDFEVREVSSRCHGGNFRNKTLKVPSSVHDELLSMDPHK